MTYLETIKKEIENELAEAIDQTGMTAEKILANWGTTIEELAEAMDQTGLSMDEILGC